MTTVMHDKLKKAGVSIPPLIQRVWQWVHDNGPHGSKAIASALSNTISNVSGALTLLLDRGMVTRREEYDRSRGRRCYVYEASHKLKIYELLPFTAESKLRNKRGVSILTYTECAKPEVAAAALAEETSETRIEACGPALNILNTVNVREAYQLYLELKTMFQQDYPK